MVTQFQRYSISTSNRSGFTAQVSKSPPRGCVSTYEKNTERPAAVIVRAAWWFASRWNPSGRRPDGRIASRRPEESASRRRHSSPIGTRHVISGRRPSSLYRRLVLRGSASEISLFSGFSAAGYSDGKTTRGKTYRTRFLLRIAYTRRYVCVIPAAAAGGWMRRALNGKNGGCVRVCICGRELRCTWIFLGDPSVRRRHAWIFDRLWNLDDLLFEALASITMTILNEQSSRIHRPFPAGAVTIPIIWSSWTLKMPRSWRPIAGRQVERICQYSFYAHLHISSRHVLRTVTTFAG